jgi:hypothetical protein
MKYLTHYEKFVLNDILDKMSKFGMESLTDKELSYLKNYSNDDNDDKVIYEDKIGPYDAKLELSTKTSDTWYGTLTIDDNEYKGYISFDENDNLIGIFDDVYSDYEGLEHEIYNFIENAYFEN